MQGAFEIIHWGHVRVFEFAKFQGKHLIVALNSNDLIREYKGREPVLPWEDKRRTIEAFRCVDEVVVARSFSPMDLLREYDVGVYVVSDEWYSTKGDEVAYMRAKGGRVCVAPRYTKISTTTIKERLLEEHLAAIGRSPEPTSVWPST